MTLEEEACYRRLLDHCWRDGGIPSDPEKCARIVGKGASAELVKAVLPMFEKKQNDDTIFVHERLEQERKKQIEWRKKSSQGGINSAKSRLKSVFKGGSKMVPTICQPPPQPNVNSPVSSFLSPVSSLNPDIDIRISHPLSGDAKWEPFTDDLFPKPNAGDQDSRTIQVPDILAGGEDAEQSAEAHAKGNGEVKAKRARKEFIKPTLEEVRTRCTEKSYELVDPFNFWTHYEANGWKMGPSSMKNWTMALANWENRARKGVYP